MSGISQISSLGKLPINTGISANTDALIVRTIPSEIDLALGRLGGQEAGLKFGRNSDIDTASAPEDVWEGGDDYTGQPVNFTPETVDVFSSSTADDAAGTGAKTIRIAGLKTSSSTAYETEDIAMDGTTAVTSSETWWRLNRAYVLTAGSGGENAGAITVRSTNTTANVFASIPAGYNQTQIAAYTVPAGKQFLLKRFRTAITRANGSAGSATVTLRMRPSGGVYRAIRAFELQTGAPTEFTSFAGEIIEAGSDIKVRVDQVSDNNTIIDSAFEYILIG